MGTQPPEMYDFVTRAETSIPEKRVPHPHRVLVSPVRVGFRDARPPRFFGISLLAAGLALAIATGCKPVGPDYQRPNFTPLPIYKETGATAVTVPPPPSPANGSWQPASPSDGMLRGKWWEVYQDPKLNELEERVDTVNQGVRQALETYLAAQEQVRQDRASFYPTLSAGPSVTHEHVSVNRPQNFGGGSNNSFNDLQLTAQASWEPDFWGQIRRTVEGAKAGAQASAADLANTTLSLHALMAEDYLQMRGLDLQAQTLEASVKDLTSQLDLTKRRFAGGIGTDADVAEAQTQLETTRAQLIEVGVLRAQYEHAVGSIADYKLPNFSLPPAPLDLKMPQIPLGIPSQLLERRPDIAAAERRAAQANAQIGIAISAFYPNITLSGLGGFESTHGGTWIQGPSALWSLGAQATQLLLDGGKRKAVTNQARDLWEASASNYKGVVFLAFNEVEDKLSNLRILEQEERTELAAIAAAQHSLDISEIRYKGGVTSYVEVLTAENALIQNQVTESTLKTRQFAASVELIKALGGGWDASQLPK